MPVDLTQAREALADRDRLDTITGKGGIAWLATPENMALANRVRAEDAWTHLRDSLSEVDRLGGEMEEGEALILRDLGQHVGDLRLAGPRKRLRNLVVRFNHVAELLGVTPESLTTDETPLLRMLAEVDRLTARNAELEPFVTFHRGKVDGLNARIAELEQARARDVAGIVGWLRRRECTDSEHDSRWCPTCEHDEDIATAIEAGDWHDGTLPADPRDAEIVALRAEVASLRAVADMVVTRG